MVAAIYVVDSQNAHPSRDVLLHAESAVIRKSAYRKASGSCSFLRHIYNCRECKVITLIVEYFQIDNPQRAPRIKAIALRFTMHVSHLHALHDTERLWIQRSSNL